MRFHFWKRGGRFARVEFHDGRPARIVRGVVRFVHRDGFVTLVARGEIFHWRENEVRLVHLCSSPDRIGVRKEASF